MSGLNQKSPEERRIVPHRGTNALKVGLIPVAPQNSLPDAFHSFLSTMRLCSISWVFPSSLVTAALRTPLSNSLENFLNFLFQHSSREWLNHITIYSCLSCSKSDPFSPFRSKLLKTGGFEVVICFRTARKGQCWSFQVYSSLSRENRIYLFAWAMPCCHHLPRQHW